jgi:hypothetical protein
MNPERITQPDNIKIDYFRVLESIKDNNGRLKEIASKFLEKPELLKIVPAQLNRNQPGYGVNSIREADTERIHIEGIQINPQHMTEEVAMHELVHFFSMPALRGAFDAKQKNELEKLPENIQTYWNKTTMLWDYVKSKGYRATNNNSVHDTIVEFAVNFTNEQSEQELKELNAYSALVDSFFEYYRSLKIREE